MDPVTALMGGLSAIGATIGETAIKDGYEALQALLAREFGTSAPRLTERVDDYVQDPETFAKPAEKALRESGAAQDKEVIDQVTALSRSHAPQSPRTASRWKRLMSSPLRRDLICDQHAFHTATVVSIEIPTEGSCSDAILVVGCGAILDKGTGWERICNQARLMRDGCQRGRRSARPLCHRNGSPG
jgi:hypothetical protein